MMMLINSNNIILLVESLENGGLQKVLEFLWDVVWTMWITNTSWFLVQLKVIEGLSPIDAQVIAFELLFLSKTKCQLMFQTFIFSYY